MDPHHHHEHSHRLTSLNKAFIIGIALNITFVIVEFGVGFYYNSLGLLSDAGHNLGDVASLVLAMLAFRLENYFIRFRLMVPLSHGQLGWEWSLMRLLHGFS